MAKEYFSHDYSAREDDKIKKELDLFGNEIIKNTLLRDKFIEPPFSVLDSKSGSWKKRRNAWKNIGIKSEIGRNVKSIGLSDNILKIGKNHKVHKGTSTFDPALCEVLYYWFVPKNGTILDPFAGGSVRGIVANYLGYKYTGIELRQEQVDCNREQALNILPINKQPQWIIGDSNKELCKFNNEFDFIFSCPPYANLEVYSDLKGDISNMPYNKFLKTYKEIIAKSCNLLKSGGYACFVVGEVRDKKGNYIGFVPDTINAFKNAGVKYYNECIYLQGLAGACMTAGKQMKSSNKLRKIHQNVLVFKK